MGIILFLLTNFAVMFTFGTFLKIIKISYGSLLSLVIFSGLLGFSGSFISLFLSKWLALKSTGGKIIKSPTNSIETWLKKIVFEQASTVGIKTPDVAIYDSTQMNAFATGPSKNSSLIAVSTKLLENMPKKEIKGVIAHEIGHIKNGDMVTMVLMQGVVNTFVFFCSRFIAGIASMSLSKEKEEINQQNYLGNNSILYSVISFFLEVVFSFLANIIIMGFSRYREYKADAASAKLVGTQTIISALKTLKKNYVLSNLQKNMSSLYINGQNSNYKLRLFMSHPSIDQRIKALQEKKFS